MFLHAAPTAMFEKAPEKVTCRLLQVLPCLNNRKLGISGGFGKTSRASILTWLASGLSRKLYPALTQAKAGKEGAVEYMKLRA